MSRFRVNSRPKTNKDQSETLTHMFKQTSRKLGKPKYIPHLEALNLIHAQFYADLETFLMFNKEQVR